MASEWRKSSYSSSGGQCVEVTTSDAVLIRDTTNRAGLTLSVSPAAWIRFTASIKLHLVQARSLVGRALSCLGRVAVQASLRGFLCAHTPRERPHESGCWVEEEEGSTSLPLRSGGRCWVTSAWRAGFYASQCPQCSPLGWLGLPAGFMVPGWWP